MNLFSEYLNSLVRNHPDNISLIAHNARLSRPSLYDLINGKNLPRNSTLNNLCSALSLSESSSGKLRNLNKSERLRTSRKEQENYLKQKKILISEVSTMLLGKGHEISRPQGSWRSGSGFTPKYSSNSDFNLPDTFRSSYHTRQPVDLDVSLLRG
jgi:hypothetical protein